MFESLSKPYLWRKENANETQYVYAYFYQLYYNMARLGFLTLNLYLWIFEIDLKSCITALLYIPKFLFDIFDLVTWDDIDLYYGHTAQEVTNVRKAIHADSLFFLA